MPTPRFLSIGGVAETLGVSTSTLRLWETKGLIPPASRLGGSDRRVYDLADLDRLRPIAEERRRAKTAIAV